MSEQPPLTSNSRAPLPPRPKLRGWINVLAALLLLVSGGVIGGVVGSLVVRNQVIQAIKDPHGRMMRVNQEIRAELNLTDEQHDKIKQILDQHHTTILQLRGQIFDNIGMIQQEIEEVLTPEQAAMWERRTKTLDRRNLGFQRFDRHRPPHHRPGGRGPLADVDALFGQSDRDRDGKLTVDEFAAGNEGRGHRMFSHVDADDDGYLTREEIESFKQEFSRGLRRGGMRPPGGRGPAPRQP